MQIKLILFIVIFSLTVRAVQPEDAARLTAESGRTYTSGHFIIPNEGAYYLFERVNRTKRGVMISVGTFRALAAASYGDYEELIMADLDQRVVDFNSKQIEVLKQSPTFPEFLARLTGLPELVPELADELRRSLQSGASEMIDVQLTRTIEDRSPLEAKYIKEILYFAQFDRSRSFVRSANAYRRLRQLAVNGKIHSIAADLGGSKTYSQLADLLKRQRQVVSTIDVSNAIEPLMASRVKTAFLANLAKLPLSPDAALNFTTLALPKGYDSFAGSAFGWLYVSYPIDKFMKAAGQLKPSPDALKRFLEINRANAQNLTEPFDSGSCKKIYRSTAH